MRFLQFAAVLLLVGCGVPDDADSDAFEATAQNDAVRLAQLLDDSGNPDARNAQGDSLVYIATGPRGGEEVLRLLLARGANPDFGSGKYTPLMNASSWCWSEGVRLLDAAADPRLQNERGQSALETVCVRGSGRDEVLKLLRAAVN